MPKSRKRMRAEASASSNNMDNKMTTTTTTTSSEATSSSSSTASSSMLPPASRSNSNSKNGRNSRSSSSSSSSSNNNKSNDDDGFVLGSKLSLPSLLMDHASATMTNNNNSLSNYNSNPNSANSKSSLFGRVMQQSSSAQKQQQQHHSKNHHPTSTTYFSTPTKAKRPTRSSFLSPGGFGLRNAVEAAVEASPLGFAKHYFGNDNNSNNSNSQHSPTSSPVPARPAWRQADASLQDLPMDYAMKTKLVWQSAALDPPCAWRWMQRTYTTTTTTTPPPPSLPTTRGVCKKSNLDDLSQAWQQARSYWQYTPAATTTTNNNNNTLTRQEYSIVSSNLPPGHSSRLPETVVHSKMAANKTAFSKMTNSDRAWQQLQLGDTVDTTTTADQTTWRTAFLSLYQSWRLDENKTTTNDDSCFYGQGADHEIVFCHAANHQPQVLISSCNKTFREWCQTQGVTLFMGQQAWDEENMTRVAATTPTKSLGLSADDNNNNNTNKKTMTSPAAAAELAALRRAHVLKQTVGADVSVSFRSSSTTALRAVAEQRKAWQQVPPLRVVGTDDCAAVAEYYLNCAGQIAASSSSSALPVLVAPRPFSHATLQQATVRLQAGGRVEVHGLLLPRAVRDMGRIVIQALQEGLQGDDDGEEDKAIRLEMSCSRAMSSSSSSNQIRPLDQVVVGQATLRALQEDGLHHVETVSQIVWDSDQPDNLSYKVTAAP